MPTIDGIKTCEELKKCIKEPQPPIIATSSIDGFITHITPGLFFVSFFFGVQFKMITNIQNSYILEDTVHYTLDKLLESKRISSLQDSLIKDTL